MKMFGSLLAAGIAMAAAPALAVPVNWTDWTAASANQVVGTVQVGATPVSVTFNGAYLFAQTNGGTNYWTEGSPAPYTSGTVDNAPPASDIIGLNTGGTFTLDFGQSILNPIIALVSWNSNTVTFSGPIETVSEGRGYWGDGAFANVTANGFNGSGELHGIVRVLGNYTQISVTHTSENWHGIQVGVEGLTPPPPPPPPEVPVPLPLALLGTGIAALAIAGRRKRG